MIFSIHLEPVAKTKKDRLAVIEAMTSGNPKFFFGSDSAPHPISKKMGDNPPAGIFSAPVALPLLCEIFDRKGKLNGLENFVSRFGARFYNLPLNRGKITLVREGWIVPFEYAGVGIFKAGETINWSIED